MKKFMLTAMTLLAVSACADLSKYTTVAENATTKDKMRACLISEANNKLQAGTLFSAGISATADELVNTCISKLALQSVGISEESKSTAETIISNLKNLTSTTSSN